jgi:hypothetical protein
MKFLLDMGLAGSTARYLRDAVTTQSIYVNRDCSACLMLRS